MSVAVVSSSAFLSLRPSTGPSPSSSHLLAPGSATSVLPSTRTLVLLCSSRQTACVGFGFGAPSTSRRSPVSAVPTGLLDTKWRSYWRKITACPPRGFVVASRRWGTREMIPSCSHACFRTHEGHLQWLSPRVAGGTSRARVHPGSSTAVATYQEF
jgi:hypothetical protein